MGLMGPGGKKAGHGMPASCPTLRLMLTGAKAEYAKAGTGGNTAGGDMKVHGSAIDPYGLASILSP
jgi:hypothetical protein